MPPDTAPPVRVLVVDDEEDFAIATAERFARRGYQARIAISGPDALALASSDPFDVVILDLRMPDMDGLATMRALRRIAPDLQVIFLTGHGTVGSGIAGMELGAADFLQKPVPFDLLCHAVEAAAERTREVREERGRKGMSR
jgi:two-component system OmpR family response regulator